MGGRVICCRLVLFSCDISPVTPRISPNLELLVYCLLDVTFPSNTIYPKKEEKSLFLPENAMILSDLENASNVIILVNLITAFDGVN